MSDMSMSNPENFIVLTELEMQTNENFRPHLEIEIPDVPDFGDFEEMPRGHPILKKHLTDNLGEDDNNSIASTNSIQDGERLEEEQHHPSLVSTHTLADSEKINTDIDYVIVNVCGYNYKIITTGLTEDEIEDEIRTLENDALDYLLDNNDTMFM